MTPKLLALLLVRAFVLTLTAVVLAHDSVGWGVGVVVAAAAWLLLLAGTRFRFGSISNRRSRMLVALGDALCIAFLLVNEQAASNWAWALLLIGLACWYVAIRSSRSVSDRDDMTIRSHEHRAASPPHADMLDMRRKLWITNAVLIAGTVLLTLGLDFGVPWYSYLILIAAVVVADIYLFRDALRSFLSQM